MAPVLFGLLLYFAIVLWMLFDTVRRGRDWVRWQVLLFFLSIVAVPLWLVRRRQWPVTVDISPTRKLKFAALAAAIVVPSLAMSIATAAAATRKFFQVVRVEGPAMSPTINNQDRLVVNKRAYRVGEPAIGDIVMLRYPRDPGKTFVMRVVASPGDEVRIVDGVVFRNATIIDDSYVPAAYRSHEDWGPQLVPESAYFVMGDHRNSSSDSREWGFVPREYVLGRVALRWWPLSARRRFSSPGSRASAAWMPLPSTGIAHPPAGNRDPASSTPPLPVPPEAARDSSGERRRNRRKIMCD